MEEPDRGGGEGGRAMKLRLHGTPQECRRAVEELAGLFEVEQ